jgi:hypothetical protein
MQSVYAESQGMLQGLMVELLPSQSSKMNGLYTKLSMRFFSHASIEITQKK